MLIARTSDQVASVQPASSVLSELKQLDGRSDQHDEMEIEGRRYRVCQVDWRDEERHRAYQRLRAEVFVRQLGWDVPVDDDGCERDRYDIASDPRVVVRTVEGVEPNGTAHLLAGIRVFRLRTWDDSMLMHEFREAGMVPPALVQYLTDRFSGPELLELTRFCSRSGRWFPRNAEGHAAFDLSIARDLCHAAIYREGERHGSHYALGLADTVYGRVMKRAHYVYETLYQRTTHARHGYLVTLLDLPATIRAIRGSGDAARADRMVALSEEKFL
ncbi:MAG: hypothetical protein PVSMB4_01290 [Ktedonobacterales bacterium]